MIPPPPRSTLFPYTTLFRSLQTLFGMIKIFHVRAHKTRELNRLAGGTKSILRGLVVLHRRNVHTQRADLGLLRSEEHTSELQSRQYLVCRLLLEKKKGSKLNAATVSGPSARRRTSSSSASAVTTSAPATPRSGRYAFSADTNETSTSPPSNRTPT